MALCVRYFKNDTVDFKEVEILLQESIETFLGFFCKCSINHRIWCKASERKINGYQETERKINGYQETFYVLYYLD